MFSGSFTSPTKFTTALISKISELQEMRSLHHLKSSYYIRLTKAFTSLHRHITRSHQTYKVTIEINPTPLLTDYISPVTNKSACNLDETNLIKFRFVRPAWHYTAPGHHQDKGCLKVIQSPIGGDVVAGKCEDVADPVVGEA